MDVRHLQRRLLSIKGETLSNEFYKERELKEYR